MAQLVYHYGPHNVHPGMFSDEKEKNERLYFLAYDNDKKDEFISSIEKFKECLSDKKIFLEILWLLYLEILRLFQGCQ